MASPIGVAIVGASGYAARDLIQILLKHPGVKITAATSRQDEAPRVDALHPSLAKRIDLTCETFDADRIAEKAGFAFLALPHTASMAVVPALRERNVKVIDLSADYRLADPQVYEDWYGHAHTDVAGLGTAVYGLPELFRERIPPAGLIANPGCYTSASILGLADIFPTAEDHHPYNNRTWYGASKIMLEGLLRSYNDMYGLNYVAMRYFNVYGPRMDVEGKYTEVLVRWVQRINQGIPPLILGDGTTSMDFIYIEDLARANVLGLQSDATDEVFHIASGNEDG